MGLRILHGNVLDAKTDSIVLTIDGLAQGMEGGIARAFAKKWPEAWEEIECEIPYPMTLGEVIGVEPSSGFPFLLVMIASTLHHKDTLTESDKKGVVRTAIIEAMHIASGYDIKSIAAPVMSGGWRLSPSSAFMAMVEAYEEFLQKGKDLSLHIYVLDTRQYETISSIARGMGILSS